MAKRASDRYILRDKASGRYVTSPTGRWTGARDEVTTAKGEKITIYRDKAGRITSQRSADRIRSTSERAAASLRRLAKR